MGLNMNYTLVEDNMLKKKKYFTIYWQKTNQNILYYNIQKYVVLGLQMIWLSFINFIICIPKTMEWNAYNDHSDNNGQNIKIT